jgi:hypothetical protein
MQRLSYAAQVASASKTAVEVTCAESGVHFELSTRKNAVRAAPGDRPAAARPISGRSRCSRSNGTEPFMELSRRDPRLRMLEVPVRLAVVAYPA